MEDFPNYYQSDFCNYVLARQNDFFHFSAFNLKRKCWVHNHKLTYRVYDDMDYHPITTECAEKITDFIKANDTITMTHDELVARVAGLT